MAVNADVIPVLDLPYVTGPEADDAKHRLDLYRPADVAPDGGWPVFLFVHGGGWHSGDRRYLAGLYANVGRAVAAEGILGVVISYRLAPGVQHPEQVRDVARAVRWTVDRIAEHGGDPTRLVIGGHSAGGHLSALLALDPRWLGEVDLRPDCLRGTAGMSGVYSLSGMGQVRTLRSLVVNAFGPDEATWADASPLTHVRAGAPPFWLNNAQFDWGLEGQSERFEQALRAVGVPVERTLTEGTNHMSVITQVGAADDLTTRRLVDFVRRVTANR